MNHLFRYALEQRASDIHIEPKRDACTVRYRIDGVLHTIHTGRIGSDMRTDLELDVGALRFDERGLIPAVVQDLRSRKVLTLAYMNRESLEITLREGRTCFYSRSRGTLWRKGETSGNVQRVASVRPDCDGDALLVEVVKDGPDIAHLPISWKSL